MNNVFEYLKNVTGLEQYIPDEKSIKSGFKDFLKDGRSLIDITGLNTTEKVIERLNTHFNVIKAQTAEYGLIKAKVAATSGVNVFYVYFVSVKTGFGCEIDMEMYKSKQGVFISEDMIVEGDQVEFRAIFIDKKNINLQKWVN